jgi:hypothetical protein
MQTDSTPARALPAAGHNLPERARIPGTTLPAERRPVARIFRPARSAMTSAPLPRPWIVEFERRDRPAIEPLMGWTTQEDPLATIRLSFRDLGSALDFVAAQGWDWAISETAPHRPRPIPRSEQPWRDRIAASALRRAAGAN